MDLSQAVEKTIAYGSYFNFPLSAEEVHFWLISPHPVSKSAIKKYLPVLKPEEILLRKTLLKNTRQKEKITIKFIKYARFIPSIRLIAHTGSVAVNNSKKDDDLDLLIITSPHTLWLTRVLLLLLLSLKFKRRHPGDNASQTKNTFCPNLWLDTLSLSVPKNRRNIYTAHEVLQVRPLFDRGRTHAKFILANSWTKHYLANAYSSFSEQRKESPVIPGSTRNLYKLLIPLNFIAFLIQYLYMLPKKTSEAVSLHAAYFHKTDFSSPLKKYLGNKSV